MKPETPSLTVDRRSFLRQSSVAAAGLGFGTIPIIGAEKEKKKPEAETLVKTFYDSLSEEQKKAMCFPYDHKLRLKIENNWLITKTLVEHYNKDQQAMIKEIFMGIFCLLHYPLCFLIPLQFTLCTTLKNSIHCLIHGRVI